MYIIYYYYFQINNKTLVLPRLCNFIQMGSCLSCLKKKENVEESIEFSNVMNNAVTCKVALMGGKLSTELSNKTNTYTVKSQGDGVVLGSCPLDCDTAFWEVKIGDNPGGVRVGVKRYSPKAPVSLDTLLDSNGETQPPSWSLSGVEFKTGDVVGICWDQTDLPMLTFLLNGTPLLSNSINRVRPANDIYPAVSLENGSSCEIVFDGNHFTHGPHNSKFSMIVCATSLI
jgi:hypothetical protein